MEFNVVDKVIEILRKYPLCDRCLGRLFAQLGKALDNAERGKALKICAILELHRRILAKEADLEILKEIARNCSLAKPLASSLGIDISSKSETCYICGSRIEQLIEYGVKVVKDKLSELNAKRFLVGVIPPKDMVLREREVIASTGVNTWESIRSELKRVIGKRVRDEYGYTPDFEDPQVTVIIDFNSDNVWVEIPSLMILGTYWKFGRRISQVPWIERNGSRRYPLAIEDALQLAAAIAQGEKAIFHGAGREDVDVRMLGSGRPFVLEVHRPLRRDVAIVDLEIEINRFSPWLGFQLEQRVRREVIANVKSSRGYKIYRALVLTKDPVSDEDLKMLEEFFRGKVIEQRTPRRILRRKKDLLRRRKVISVKTLKIMDTLFEALIKAEGGLYIKELISGDEGRTKPSFSDVLGTRAECLELDVVYVQKQI